MIEFKGVSLVYKKKNIQALRDINLRIEKGEFAFLIGPTGSGKTTLLELVYREQLPTEGKVFVAEKEVTRMRGGAIPRLRRSIGVVFQDYRLLQEKTVWQNIAFALYVTGAPRREMHTRVREVLELVGMVERGDAHPQELSGGEQQRVSIARALASNPPILLADEPTGNLDPDTSWDIMQLLDRINLRGTTVVVASHDLHVVDRLKKRVIAIENGAIVRDEAKGKYYELAKS